MHLSWFELWNQSLGEGMDSFPFWSCLWWKEVGRPGYPTYHHWSFYYSKRRLLPRTFGLENWS